MTASRIALGSLVLAAVVEVAAAGGASYEVRGNKVDAVTLSGWKTWRALACERCHGKDQQGEPAAGPSLVDGMKDLTLEQFKEVVLKGRVPQGMPNFDGSKLVTENIDGLYAYLKGRSEGAIPAGKLEPLP